MSASEIELFEVVAHSVETDAVQALRDALTGILKGLIAAGCGPHHMRDMIWETDRPEAFHFSRHAVELAYREVFAGFRPTIRMHPRQEPGLTISARLVAPPPLPDTRVEGYTLRELGRQYSPRTQADMKAVLNQWSLEGGAFRARHGGLDLAYGAGRYETLDLYRPAGQAPAPLFFFIHGGYWQATDKSQHVQFAQGLLDAGFAVAMPNYGLAPETPLEASLAQVVAALNFLVGEADALGIDASRLHLSGHSAGGHLAAMALCTADAPPISSALLLSGLYELEPLGHLPVGKLLGLDEVARAKRLSPVTRRRPATPRIEFAVGADESDAFKSQSARLAKAWQAPEPHIYPGHHFSMLEGLNGGGLLDLALATAAA